jgi:FixJ family two-component response regulator
VTQDKAIVFVIDDDPGVRDSLKELLNSVGLCIETFASATDFLEARASWMDGCIILDVRMPGMSGLELQRKLTSIASSLPIIFLTAHGDVPTAVQAVQAGAIDFIEKPFRPQELIDKVHHGLKENARRRSEMVRRDLSEQRINSLTPREREVLDTILDGKGTAAAAKELGISRRTVEVHRANLMKKLQVDSVLGLAQLTKWMRE